MWIIALVAIVAVAGAVARLQAKSRMPAALPAAATIASQTRDAVDGQRVELFGQVFAVPTVRSPYFDVACVAARGMITDLTRNTGSSAVTYVAATHFYLFDDSGMVQIALPQSADAVAWHTVWVEAGASNLAVEHETTVKDGDLLWVSGVATWILDEHKPRHPRDASAYRESPNRILQITGIGGNDTEQLVVADDRALMGALVATANPKRMPRATVAS
jgi:hypothetical protein